ncbi:hypothetical protein QZH41_014687 [Actinostola sp. cb2023]|nr:hypothetical protein QZH41_014687 [Actinostola sp. cb2023]
MKFKSTRGRVSDVTFEDGIFMGCASDGGLLMPELIPKLDIKTWGTWKDLSYVDLSVEILSLFISESEISKTELRDIVSKAYGSQFVCPIPQLTDNLYILELFHGKTKAFKDIPLALVSQFLDFFLERQNKHVTLLVVTSGDTGSAAIESVRRSKYIDIVVLFPNGYCNKVQELQMTTVQDDNVHVFAVEGTSDNADVPMKACLVDKEFVDEYNLGSINSMNIGRIVSQIIYYFYAYFQVCQKVGEPVKIVVPTGGMGNITAGCIAHKMGLPIALQSAVNDNNSVYKTLTTGKFVQGETAIKTWSTAMDIQVPSNMERILYLFSDSNASLISALMKEFEEQGTVQLPLELKEKVRNGFCFIKLESIISILKDIDIGETITSDWVSKDEVLATMKRIWDTNQYVLCPHTAVGVTVELRSRYALAHSAMETKSIPCVCIATASPAKFIEAVEAANIEYIPPPEILNLEKMKTRCEQMKKDEDWEEILRRKIINIG